MLAAVAGGGDEIAVQLAPLLEDVEAQSAVREAAPARAHEGERRRPRLELAPVVGHVQPERAGALDDERRDLGPLGDEADVKVVAVDDGALGHGGSIPARRRRPAHSRLPVRENLVFEGPDGFTGTIGAGAKSCASTEGAGTASGEGAQRGAPGTSASRQQRKPTK